eukprot:Pgem_evm1s3055
MFTQPSEGRREGSKNRSNTCQDDFNNEINNNMENTVDNVAKNNNQTLNNSSGITLNDLLEKIEKNSLPKSPKPSQLYNSNNNNNDNNRIIIKARSNSNDCGVILNRNNKTVSDIENSKSMPSLSISSGLTRTFSSPVSTTLASMFDAAATAFSSSKENSSEVNLVPALNTTTSPTLLSTSSSNINSASDKASPTGSSQVNFTFALKQTQMPVVPSCLTPNRKARSFYFKPRNSNSTNNKNKHNSTDSKIINNSKSDKKSSNNDKNSTPRDIDKDSSKENNNNDTSNGSNGKGSDDNTKAKANDVAVGGKSATNTIPEAPPSPTSSKAKLNNVRQAEVVDYQINPENKNYV